LDRSVQGPIIDLDEGLIRDPHIDANGVLAWMDRLCPSHKVDGDAGVTLQQPPNQGKGATSPSFSERIAGLNAVRVRCVDALLNLDHEKWKEWLGTIPEGDHGLCIKIGKQEEYAVLISTATVQMAVGDYAEFTSVLRRVRRHRSRGFTFDGGWVYPKGVAYMWHIVSDEETWRSWVGTSTLWPNRAVFVLKMGLCY
jgi:hypothetical protein